MLSVVEERVRRFDHEIDESLSIHRLDLGGSEPSADVEACLPASEIARANAFRDAQLRARFVWCRAALRLILGKQLECPPVEVNLRSSETGRPFLDDAGFDFNVSHSDDLALVALLSGNGQVGVDLERLSALSDLPGLAKRVFTERELEFILQQDGAQTEAFYRLWTCKESYLKAIGTGFAIEPLRIDIDLGNANAPLLRNTPDPRPCRIESIRPMNGFIGAVTILRTS